MEGLSQRCGWVGMLSSWDRNQENSGRQIQNQIAHPKNQDKDNPTHKAIAIFTIAHLAPRNASTQLPKQLFHATETKHTPSVFSYKLAAISSVELQKCQINIRKGIVQTFYHVNATGFPRETPPCFTGLPVHDDKMP